MYSEKCTPFLFCIESSVLITITAAGMPVSVDEGEEISLTATVIFAGNVRSLSVEFNLVLEFPQLAPGNFY